MYPLSLTACNVGLRVRNFFSLTLVFFCSDDSILEEPFIAAQTQMCVSTLHKPHGLIVISGLFYNHTGARGVCVCTSVFLDIFEIFLFVVFLCSRRLRHVFFNRLIRLPCLSDKHTKYHYNELTCFVFVC